MLKFNLLILLVGHFFGTISCLAVDTISFTLKSDVSYLGQDRTEKLDIYLPTVDHAKLTPAVLFIHGGGWVSGNKSDKRSRNIATFLAGQGYAVFSIDYKLTEFSGKRWQSKIAVPGWPQNIYDCKTALRYIRCNAGRYNIDADRIAIMGCSAGGHLALLTGFTSENQELNAGGLYKKYSCKVNCIIDMYGIP